MASHKHELCGTYGCNNSRINGGNACKDHLCNNKDCNNACMFNRSWCMKHVCEMCGCDNPRIVNKEEFLDKGYVPEHVDKYCEYHITNTMYCSYLGDMRYECKKYLISLTKNHETNDKNLSMMPCDIIRLIESLC